MVDFFYFSLELVQKHFFWLLGGLFTAFYYVNKNSRDDAKEFKSRLNRLLENPIIYFKKQTQDPSPFMSNNNNVDMDSEIEEVVFFIEKKVFAIDIKLKG